VSAPSDYRAPWWLAGAHAQTVYGSLFAPGGRMAYRRERWETPDGDFIDLDFADGPADAPFVLLFHGLEGSSASGYARRLMRHATARGWRGAVVNFRGCSGEMNRRPRAYHSGDSEEADWVLRRMKERIGARPLHAAGVSLGGNVLLKWLGERGEDATTVVASAAAVCAPVDLMAAGDALEVGFARFYADHFLDTLKRRSLQRLALYPGLFDRDAMLASRTLRQFDNAVTAPLHGFRDTDDYYTRASSKPLLCAIRVPTLVLNAQDDPFLPPRFLPVASQVSSAVRLEQPAKGGHVGFVRGGFPLLSNIDWMPQRLLRFFSDKE
jgi:predicted alpha/beta-fold hydrolase